eukprot:1883575-Pleurochrysis_carterae.AAC.1
MKLCIASYSEPFYPTLAIPGVICAFPIPAASRRAAAHAVLLSTRAASMHDAKAALVEAMVSFHHGYQALQRGIARQ